MMTIVWLGWMTKMNEVDLYDKFPFIDEIVIAAVLDFNSGDVVRAKQMLENYAGTFDDKAAWAEEIIDVAHGQELKMKGFGELARYIDYEAYGRDAQLGGSVTFITLPSGKVASFHS